MISVLYVDDEPFLLDICKAFLERSGDIKVETSISAVQALERLSNESFDAIVSDYQMPEMNGIDFLITVRKQNKSLPFIVFTGRGREEIAINALKEGADFYLQKGGDPRSQYAELKNQILQIVKLRKAESDLVDSEKIYHTLFEAAQEPILLLDDGRILDCNHRMEEVFSRARDEIIGQTPGDLSPPVQPDGSNSIEKARSIIQLALEGQPQFFEWSHITSEGTLFDAEVSLNRIEVKGRYLLLAILRDVTERKKIQSELQRKSEELEASYEQLMGAEEELRFQYSALSQKERELRISEEKLRSILASMDDLVLTMDDKGVFLDYFKKKTDEYFILPEFFIGRDYRDVLPKDLADLLGESLQRVIKTGETEQITYSLEVTGRFRYYCAKISKRFDEEGNTAGVTLVARDITAEKHAEGALSESKAQLEAVIQGTPILQFVIDKNHLVTHWNRALAEYSGIPSEEVIGTNKHWSAFYPEERPCLADLLISGLTYCIPEWYGCKYIKSELTDEVFEVVDFFPRMGDAGKWLDFTATLIRDENGDIIGAIETLEDITDQKNAETALIQSEKLYRNVIENIQDVYYRSDRNGNLIMASPSILRLLEYSSFEEILGRNIADTFYYNSEDRTQFLKILSQTGAVTSYEITLRRRDGTPVFVSTSSHYYLDSEGQVAGVEGIFHDITEQKETYKKLRQQEAILNAVIQESPVPEFVIDRNHQIIHWNQALAKYSGISASEIVGTNQHWRAFYPQERPCLADLLVEGATGELEAWYTRKYASSRLIEGAFEAVDFFPHLGEKGSWLYFTAAPIRDNNGEIIGAVEILEDVSEQKRAEAELRSVKQYLEGIIMNANVWIMVLDTNTDVIIWNNAAEEISGYSAVEVIGTHWIWKALYPEEQYRREISGEIVRIITDNLYLHNLKTTIQSKYGCIKRILWNSRALRDENGEITGYVAVGVENPLSG